MALWWMESKHQPRFSVLHLPMFVMFRRARGASVQKEPNAGFGSLSTLSEQRCGTKDLMSFLIPFVLKEYEALNAMLLVVVLNFGLNTKLQKRNYRE